MRVNKERGQVARRLLHTTVFAQCFSPCGKYVAAASNFGHIAVFNLATALAPEASEETRKPVFTFKASDAGAVFALVSTDSLLISAGDGDICAWRWQDILDKAPKQTWALKIKKTKPFTNPEVNSLVTNQQDGSTYLYAGCGDNNIYVWDIETGDQTLCLSGHEDYVHCVALKNSGRECVSAAEDGTVRIWDCRTKEAVHILEPSKNEQCARPELGKWLGCVAVDTDNDWLVCGGGPRLSSWRLRSLSATTVFDTPGVCQKHAMFYDDTVISGGSQPYVNHWFMNGDLKSQVPCSPTSVYSIAFNSNSETYKVLSISGTSSKVDVCTNFGYKAFSYNFVVT